MHIPRHMLLALGKWIGAVVILLVVLWQLVGGAGIQSGSAKGSSIPATLSTSQTANPNRPVLAFYYMWYHKSDWCTCKMSDLPASKYVSSDDVTIDRQLSQAANAGINGFISSWWGAGDNTDKNFAKLLTHSAALETKTGQHFASSIYFESDAPNFNSFSKIVSALKYLKSHYMSDSHFFHSHGKPVLFFWNPVGNGRSLGMWANVRQQVDPGHQMIWSAETIDTSLFSVFDGLHLFSAGYWGLQHGNMPAVDQGFRNKITAYNNAHHTHKIWAAGVEPGYDDTRIRHGYIVPRNNGATYRTSWSAAISSNPDWITITTFNEWFEGAMIEPSVHYGSKYLDITKQYATKWHG